MRNLYDTSKRILAILMTWLAVTSAMPGTDGLQQVRDIYKRMSRAADEHAVIYLSYTVKAELSEAAAKVGMKTTTSDIEVIIGKKHSRCLSKEMSFYEDEQNSFTVIPSRKVIYWSGSTRRLNANRSQQMGFLQDTLLQMSKVVEVKQEKGKNAFKCVVIQPNENAQRMFKVNRMSFYIDESLNEIKKVVITYPKDHQLSSTEIVFNKIDMDYAQADISRPVKSFFLQGKNQLLPEYKNYTLVDTRNKK